MTSRDRLITALRKGKPDRPPVFIRGVRWFERPGHKDPSYDRLYEMVEARCDYIRFWGAPAGRFLNDHPDARTTSRLLRVEGDWEVWELVLRTPKGDLVSVRRESRSGHPGLTEKFFIKSPADVEAFLSVPYEEPSPDASSFFDLDCRLGDRGIVMPDVRTPAAHVHSLLGSEGMAYWWMDERSSLLLLRDVFRDRFERFLEHLLDAGVGPVWGFTGAELASPPLLPPEGFRELVVNADGGGVEKVHSRALRQAQGMVSTPNHGGVVRVHCHGGLRLILDGFHAMGVDALHPVESPPMGDITLMEFRERVGLDICIKGNIQVGEIMSGDAALVRSRVREAMETAGREGAFILAPTASPYEPVLTDRAFAGYKAMIEEALDEWT